jgi:hypothetical protein
MATDSSTTGIATTPTDTKKLGPTKKHRIEGGGHAEEEEGQKGGNTVQAASSIHLSSVKRVLGVTGLAINLLEYVDRPQKFGHASKAMMAAVNKSLSRLSFQLPWAQKRAAF